MITEISKIAVKKCLFSSNLFGTRYKAISRIKNIKASDRPNICNL
jgi:hypothetical protein